MLSISNVSEGMGLFYFERDDYYSRENSPAKSEFVGKAAEILGISSYDKDAYMNLLKGLDPTGKNQIAYIKPKQIDEDRYRENLERTLSVCRDSGMEPDQIDKIADTYDAFNSGKTIAPLEEVKLTTQLKGILRESSVAGSNRKKVKRALHKMNDLMCRTDRRAAYDLTFNAPKSVSLQVLVNGDDKLRDAHEDAVKYALKIAEDRCIFYKSGAKNSRSFVESKNLIGATFHHGTSREGDPHLHTHTVIFNLTQRSDGSWRAIHNDEIYRQSKLIGLVYQNKLAELSQTLGYEIDLSEHGTFEIIGFNQKHLDKFSQRRAQTQENSARIAYERDFAADLETMGFKYGYYEKFAKGHFIININEKDAKKRAFNIVSFRDGRLITDGYTGKKSFESLKASYLKDVDQKQNRVGVIRGRAIKGQIDYQDIKQSWLKRAQNMGLAQIEPNPDEKPSHWGKKLDLDFHEMHIGERTAVWSQLNAEMRALEQNLGRDEFSAIQKSIENNDFSQRIDKQPETYTDSQKLKTNLDQLSTEEQVLVYANNGIGKHSPIAMTEELQGIGDSYGFTKGQEDMVRGVLTTQDSIVACLGVAGSGKSFAAKTINEFAQTNGVKVVGLAPDATAAQALEEKSQIPSETIHRYLLRGPRKIRKNTYDKHRINLSEQLASLGVDRHNLRNISKLLDEAYSGTRYTKARCDDLNKTCSHNLKKLPSKKLVTANAKIRNFLKQVGEPEYLIIVDEASKLSSKLMRDLLERATSDGNRVALLGDLRQTGAVEAGNPVKHLVDQGKIQVVNLPETVRQKQGLLIRKVVDAAAQSNRTGMAKSIEALGDKIVTRKRKASRIAFAVKEYMKHIERGETDIMLLADLNVDRHSLTSRLRERLRDIGKIAQNEVKIRVLVDRELTEAQKTQSRCLRRDDIVVFHQSISDGPAANEKYSVLGVSKRHNTVTVGNGEGKFRISAEHLQQANVYSQDEIDVSVGDTLRWTKNHDNRVNKQLAIVDKVVKDHIDVRDPNTGETSKIRPNEFNYLDYGLVMTVYSSQGHDRKKGIFLAESNVSMNTWYTALSRMKEDVLVITDDKKKLLERISTSTAKLNALEHMERKTGWTIKHEEYKKALAQTRERTHERAELEH